MDYTDLSLVNFKRALDWFLTMITVFLDDVIFAHWIPATLFCFSILFFVVIPVLRSFINR